MSVDLKRLLDEVRACTHCRHVLPHGVRPVLQAGAGARLRLISQAPGRKVHETGIPWNDASGDRLREWLGIDRQCFYDAERVAIIPMGFCYPGRATSGDHAPRPECAPLWHERLNARLPDITLTLLIGHHAQARYLGHTRKPTMTQTVRAWSEYLPRGFMPLPHPSPRNQPWRARNPWFDEEVLPALREAVRATWS